MANTNPTNTMGSTRPSCPCVLGMRTYTDMDTNLKTKLFFIIQQKVMQYTSDWTHVVTSLITQLDSL